MSLYNTDGSYNVTIVDGTTITGLFAVDGSYNAVIVPGTSHTGLFHPCGAYNIFLSTGNEGIQHSCGALNVSQFPYLHNTQKITIVSQPPGPTPGPLDLSVTSLSGLGSFSTSLTSTSGNVIVRVVARNNAASAVGMVAKWNGVSMTNCGIVEETTVGGLSLAMFAIRGGATGTNTLAITTTGSAGVAAIRIGDVSQLGASFLGQTDGSIQTDYYWEAQLTPQPTGSDVTILAGSTQLNAYPMTWDGNLIVQNTRQIIGDDTVSKTTAWFGHEAIFHGDPYYVVYPHVSTKGGILARELIGLVP